MLQQKTQRPVQFEITTSTREAVDAWIRLAVLKADDFLFPSRLGASPHLGTRQYARIVDGGSRRSDWIQQHTAHTPSVEKKHL